MDDENSFIPLEVEILYAMAMKFEDDSKDFTRAVWQRGKYRIIYYLFSIFVGIPVCCWTFSLGLSTLSSIIAVCLAVPQVVFKVKDVLEKRNSKKAVVKPFKKTDIQLEEEEKSPEDLLNEINKNTGFFDAIKKEKNHSEQARVILQKMWDDSIRKNNSEEDDKYAAAALQSAVLRGKHIEEVGNTEADRIWAAGASYRRNQEKYDAAVAKQIQMAEEQAKRKVVSIATGEPVVNEEEEKKTFLDKDETMSAISSDIADYQVLYALPPLRLTPMEWEIFFDHFYDFCCKHGMQERFYSIAARINRHTLADVLVNKRSCICIGDYIRNLAALEILSPKENRISKEEINTLMDTLQSEVSKGKVIKLPVKTKGNK